MVSEGLRPLMQPDMPPELSQLLEECWQLSAARRPSAADLVARLEGTPAAFRAPADVEAARSTAEREAARRASSSTSAAAADRSSERAGLPAACTQAAKAGPPRWMTHLPAAGGPDHTVSPFDNLQCCQYQGLAGCCQSSTPVNQLPCSSGADAELHDRRDCWQQKASGELL